MKIFNKLKEKYYRKSSDRLESKRLVDESLKYISKYLDFIKLNNISTDEFIELFKNFDLGYIIIYPGIFNYFRGKNAIVYIDEYLDEYDDYFGRRKFRMDNISYNTKFVMAPPKDVQYNIPDYYELLLLEINASDIFKFKDSVQSIKNKAFNNRDTGFYTAMILVFKLYLETFNKEPKHFREQNTEYKNLLKNIHKTIENCVNNIDDINKQRKNK